MGMMATLRINGVYLALASKIFVDVRHISAKILFEDYCDNSELQSVVIICEYGLLVEVIRRIHSICDSPCDFVDIEIK